MRVRVHGCLQENFETEWPLAGREHWAPAFDAYNVSAAFENHAHSYKRTKRLRAHRPDPTGTWYLGEGCWGVTYEAQSPSKESEQELFDVTGTRGMAQVWVVTVNGGHVEYSAIDENGNVFDKVPS